ncbi:MAG: substrate-binding domain-containing protein, partial [Candidatus Methanoperedens sp.]|nr:substrate-binding domain-containing protein [Candidatus Methanoperedens sp.]
STAANWSDVRAEWPNEPILRFIPGTDSGTFDYFVEHFFDQDEAPILNAANLQQSEDDNVLVQGVESSPYAIGFFGYAYYQEAGDQLRAVAIDGVSPSAETVETGDYSLARPLFIYSDAGVMTSKPQVADFINYYLTNVDDVIDSVGYFKASDAALNLSKLNVLAATAAGM